jgi:5-methylcytosine-specific restriction protein B
MDETTHGLSDKVLDRAFTLEFWDIDLDAYPRWTRIGIPDDEERRTREVLTALSKALAPMRLHFGWRTIDDSLDFLVMANVSGSETTFTDLLDAIVYAKILPKLRGANSIRFSKLITDVETLLKDFKLVESHQKVVSLREDYFETGAARFWR